MHKYIVTDENNTKYLVEAEIMAIETVNNVNTYIAFYRDGSIAAIFNLENIIGVVKEID